MYCITDEQIEMIRDHIRRDGVTMEDLQSNLLDHICCIIEQEYHDEDDFERCYQQAVRRLCDGGLYKIEAETINLLKFKNYYFMKKAMMLSGAISVTSLIFGSFFKVMFWAGANVLLSAGVVVLALIFLPLMALLKIKETDLSAEKLTTVSGTFVGMLFCLAIFFAFQHWPGASSGIYWMLAIGFSLFVFIPVYFFTGIRRPEKRLNTIIITVLVVGFSCLQFAMVGLRRSNPKLPMYTYLGNEQILRNLGSGAVKNDTDEGGKLAGDINSQCEQLKAFVISREINIPAIPDDFEDKSIVLPEKLLDLRDTHETTQLLNAIRTSVEKYNALPNVSKVPVDHSILTLTPEQLVHTTNVFILNSLIQLQIHLAIRNDHNVNMAAAKIVRKHENELVNN